MQMLKVILKIQGCTTIPGRRAFVSKRWDRHGIAAGNVRFYEVIAPTWTAVRKLVAGYDTTGRRTMGFSEVRAETVEKWETVEVVGTTHTIRPLPLGTTAEQFKVAQ